MNNRGTRSRVRRRRPKGFVELTTLSLWASRKKCPSLRDPPGAGLLVVIPVGNRRIRQCLLRAAQVVAARGGVVTIRYITVPPEPPGRPAEREI